MSFLLDIVNENGINSLRIKVKPTNNFVKVFHVHSEKFGSKFRYKLRRTNTFINAESLIGDVCQDGDVIEG
jgi:hypothetical protein